MNVPMGPKGEHVDTFWERFVGDPCASVIVLFIILLSVVLWALYKGPWSTHNTAAKKWVEREDDDRDS